MRRAERAARIREVVLGYPRESWTWTDAGGMRFPTLKGDGWQALLMTAFTNTRLMPKPRTHEEAVLLQRRKAPSSNRLDLWVDGVGKVLSADWRGDEPPRVISMKRGAWEQEIFGLPPAHPGQDSESAKRAALASTDSRERLP